MTDVLLVAGLAMLCGLVYRAVYLLGRVAANIDTLIEIEENENECSQILDTYRRQWGQFTRKDLLIVHAQCLVDAKHNIDLITDAINWRNPAGPKSLKSRRVDKLIDLYTKKLIERENLSQVAAKAKAEFQFMKFGRYSLGAFIKAIEDEDSNGWQQRHAREQNIVKIFVDTGLLEGDCAAQQAKLTPLDVYKPVWCLFRYGSPDDLIEIDTETPAEDYNEYVRQRAIVLRLLELRVIAKERPRKGDVWLDRPVFRFLSQDIDATRSTIYGHAEGHNDKSMEDMLRDGKLEFRFCGAVLYVPCDE